MESRKVVASCWGKVHGKLMFNAYKVSVMRDEYVLKISVQHCAHSCKTCLGE